MLKQPFPRAVLLALISNPMFVSPVFLSLVLVSLVLANPVFADSSLRFFGNGIAAPGLDRVEIALDDPQRPVDVGAGDFTIELWLKALPGENTSNFSCTGANDDWINGNIFLDRDIFGAGDWGDWGISLALGKVMFGAADANGGATACGATHLADGQWHHLALTRRADDGQIVIWLDGAFDGDAIGPAGDISYRNQRVGATHDPFLVIGAEKHDAGAAYPSFSGWVDELRISTVQRYVAPFAVPAAPFASDASTAALYHFDEAQGIVLGDSSTAPGGPSDGVIHVGGNPSGPAWSTDTPFGIVFADGFEP